MRHKVYQYHPDFLMLFDIRFDMIQNAMGTQDNQWDYEVLRNIVGIHRFNTIGKSVEERVAMEKSDSYKKELADVVYEHLKLRNYASPYLRKRQFVEGDEFIYFPVPYKLFVICMRGLQILNDFKDPYREFYVNIFNKSLAALALIEDNLLDSAYPICRGVIELYIKLLSLVDYPDALEMHNELVRLEYIKTAQNGENPAEFEELFKNRKNKSQTNQIDYLHYGWVDKIKYFHQIEKNKPYSFSILFDFLKESAPEESKGYFEFLPKGFFVFSKKSKNIGEIKDLNFYLYILWMAFYQEDPDEQSLWREAMNVSNIEHWMDFELMLNHILFDSKF